MQAARQSLKQLKALMYSHSTPVSTEMVVAQVAITGCSVAPSERIP